MGDEFYVGGVGLSNYGVYWDGSQIWDKPAKDVKFYSVPARNGDLYSDNHRFDNINISIKCFIKDNFVENYDALMNFLYSREGYVVISNSKEADVYRMGMFVEANKPSTLQFNAKGNFTLVFNCMPQKFFVNATTATFQSYIEPYNNRWLEGIALKDDPDVKAIMRSVPEQFRSNADAFYRFGVPVQYGFSDGDTATNVTLNWSKSDVPIYVFDDYYLTANYYTMGNTTGASFTAANRPESTPPAGNTLTPMQMEGVFTFSGTKTSQLITNDFTKQSVDFSTKTGQIHCDNAMGADLTFNMQVEHSGIGSVSSLKSMTLMLGGYNGNDSKGNLFVRTDPGSISDDLRDKIEEYVHDDPVGNSDHHYYVEVKVDLQNMEVYAYKTGLPDLNLNSCFIIVGNLGRNIDTIKVFYFAGRNFELTPSLTVPPETITVTARWWKL